jgi:hypothetical protein
MRKLLIAIAVTSTVALGGALAWQANAAAPATAVPTAEQSPVLPAACGGPNVDCPPGRHRVCGPYGHNCWCAPC